MSQGEILIYQQVDNLHLQMEVRVENDTVWLNRNQLAQLFDRDIKTIGKHISNAIKEELNAIPVVAKFATTATDGKVYKVDYYNLDLIISVGYRVKSQRGIQFRIWANRVLKDYLLKGFVINQRIESIENEVTLLKRKAEEFDFHIKTTLPPHEGIFYDGQVFDAYIFIVKIIKSAYKTIILIDNYVDETVLAMLSKRNNNVEVTIYTAGNTKQFELDIQRYQSQYPAVSIKKMGKSHDRFLIIDNTNVFHIGASLKDLGKKWFAFSKIDIDASEMIRKLEEQK